MMRVIVTAVIFLLGAFFAVSTNLGHQTANPQVSIDTLANNPHQYYGQRVSITGTVVDATGIMGKGIYQLRDGKTKLLVFSSHEIPIAGTVVAIRGQLKQAMVINAREIQIFLQDGTYDPVR